MTTTYRQGLVPDDPKALPSYLRSEQRKLEEALNKAELLDKTLYTGTTRIQTILGDLWIMANAYYDAKKADFYRIDTTRAAFGIQAQAANYIPGEPDLGYFVSGVNFWVAQPAAYDLIRGGGTTAGDRFAQVGGWELGITLTQERNFTVGGMGIELDGSGTFPFGRVVHNTTGTAFNRRCTGVARNLYADFADVDDDTAKSWFMGYTEQVSAGSTVAGTERLAMVHVPAGTTTWRELFSVDEDGIQRGYTTTVAALPAAASAGAGARAFVTDSAGTTFASVVTGGGTDGVPVYCDGTDWRIG